MNNEFSLTQTLKGEYLIISTSGYINKEAGEKISEVCQKHIDRGTKKVVLDLKESKVINSIGISILIEIIEKLQQTDGKMIFANLNPAVDKTLTIMGLFQLTEKASDVNEALRL